MKTVILDSGPVISFALNGLLWVFERVKKDYDINFVITDKVKEELIDNPLGSKRFKLEALQVLRLIKKGVIEVISEQDIEDHARYLLELANSSYSAKQRCLQLVHPAEMTAISAALLHKADAVMIDERTTRYIIEKPGKLKNTLSHKLHTKVTINKKPLEELQKKTQGIKFIRSAEFATVAFEKGLLDDYLPEIPGSKEMLLDALLWGMKLGGCAISTKDLETLKREEMKVRKWA